MGANTNAPIILAIFAFYIVIGVLFGLIGSASLTAQEFSTPDDPSTFSFLNQIGYFFSGIGYTLGSIPGWANTLLFLPLGITLAYIILSYIRGSS